MTIETSVAALTTSTTALLTAVGTQQTAVATAVAGFATTTARVAALDKVENTTDLGKRISTAVQAALDAKQPTLESGVNISTVNGQSLLGGQPLVIARSATSLNSVLYDNRATLRATTSQVDDSTLVEGLGLFMWVNTQTEPDDDETCFNTPAVSALVLGVLTVTTPAGQWLLQAPSLDLIAAWNLHETAYTDDWREDEPKRFAAYLLANK